MTTNAKIGADIQQSAVGNIVELYELDATSLGDTTYYFTPAASASLTDIEWNSQVYYPIQMESSGWESSSDGQMPRPVIRVSNVSKTFAASIIAYNDLLGATLRRRRTLEKYLDGQPQADPFAEFPQELYIINRKTHHSKYYIEWELTAFMDFEGTKIPKRQILRDTCTHKYRMFANGKFDYDTNDTSCPYVASGSYAYFDRNGDNKALPANDKCGKRLTDCKLRFPKITGSVTVSDTAPVGPSTDDNWLDTSSIPNVWYKYNGNSWIEAKTVDLPTRAFPSVAKLRLKG